MPGQAGYDKWVTGYDKWDPECYIQAEKPAKLCLSVQKKISRRNLQKFESADHFREKLEAYLKYYNEDRIKLKLGG